MTIFKILTVVIPISFVEDNRWKYTNTKQLIRCTINCSIVSDFLKTIFSKLSPISSPPHL